MATIDFLEKSDYNKIVQLYTQLNVEITEDIIDRISQVEEITNTTRDELRALIDVNGSEIFLETLKKTKRINELSRKELKVLFDKLATENLKDYEDLFAYRDIAMKLSPSQKEILKVGYKQTNKTLKNFTKTIAFQSKKAYVRAVDKAYMQVLSGAFNYNTAIANACKEVARNGITLKDKAGRNVQIETAVRRNVLYGIRDTSFHLNEDIEEQLGCDGYEVPAHSAARPTHAEAQGKVYAKTKADAVKYGVGFWGDVKDLWEEYNCRHKASIHGVILAIHEPLYTKKELDILKNEKVTYNGKEISTYEASQIARKYESSIRKLKKETKILEDTGQDASSSRMRLNSYNKGLNDLCKQTGIVKDINRLKVYS